MKRLTRKAAIFIAVMTPVFSAPVLAHNAQSASNHAYAGGPRQVQSPMWHEYHNWRSRNSYQLRMGLHRQVKRNENSRTHGINEMSGSSMAYDYPALQEYHNWRVKSGALLRQMKNSRED